MALDLEGPLDRLSLQSMARSVNHFTLAETRHWFLLETPYQRGSVWDLERKQNLIRSILRGIPTGVIIVNQRPDVHEGYAVIDGKQRIEALRAFIDDEYAIPVSWVNADDIITAEPHPEWDHGAVRWSGLINPFKLDFKMRPIAASEANVTTIAEEAEIFRLINAGGVEQTAATMAVAAEVEGNR